MAVALRPSCAGTLPLRSTANMVLSVRVLVFLPPVLDFSLLLQIALPLRSLRSHYLVQMTLNSIRVCHLACFT